ncbi:MAG: hypothetical protein CM1200mP2_39020 [Planctomycetaceae bacterium]|nr:MAG: hypothetical protein CM1200mP2_39020 [Planctomycetaceae bacterium]
MKDQVVEDRIGERRNLLADLLSGFPVELQHQARASVTVTSATEDHGTIGCEGQVTDTSVIDVRPALVVRQVLRVEFSNRLPGGVVPLPDLLSPRSPDSKWVPSGGKSRTENRTGVTGQFADRGSVGGRPESDHTIATTGGDAFSVTRHGGGSQVPARSRCSSGPTAILRASPKQTVAPPGHR